MSDESLFPLGEARPDNRPTSTAAARVLHPVRNQVEMQCIDLESLIPLDHQVRTVWVYVKEADLSKLYDAIGSRENTAGRPAIDPRILLALWLWATLRGVGSARHLSELCTAHVEYRWLCGRVSVNHHTLADFRSQNGAVLEALLIAGVARLRAAGLVTLDRVAHDGLRVRANAGTKTFRRKARLEQFEREARTQVEALREEVHADPKASRTREQAARARAVREQLERVQAALQEYPEVHAKKKHNKEEARVSTTDPEARTMKMADGGFRPAYNVQLSADTSSQIVVGVSVIQSGSDHGQLIPAVLTIQKQQGTTPKEILADGGFAKPEDIETLAQAPHACSVYAPPTVHIGKAGQVLKPKKPDSASVAEWRARMKTESAKTIYQERAATIECVNALARNRGLQQFRVRGLQRVYATVLLFVLAHNLMRAESLKQAREESANTS